MILGRLAVFLSFCVCGTVTVQLAVRLMAGFLPAFGRTLVIIALGLAGGTLASEIATRTLLASAEGSWTTVALGSIQLFASTFAIVVGVRSPTGSGIGVGKALMASAVQLAVYTIVFMTMPGVLLGLVGWGHIGM